MADPVIVPPVPTVRQGEPITQVDTSPGLEQVQSVFDRVFPAIKTEPTPKSQTPPTEPAKPKEPATPEVTPSTEPQKKETEPAKQPADESHKVPSFLEEVLKGEPSKDKEQPATDEEWPEQLPTFQTSEEAKSRYKKWRDTYQNLKTELKTLREKPTLDAASTARLELLENQNREMGQVLSRMGVETHQEFQQNIIRPMAAAWTEAAKIVKDSGGNPDDLAKALSLSGKAQFEALDQIFEGMPESAKVEAHQHITAWRRFNEARVKALANAPQAMEELRKKDLARQVEIFKSQRQEQQQLFDDAIKKLRDDARVELLQTSKDPEAKWWNEQAEAVIDEARKLYLENTDMGKMAIASLLAPMADKYRKLWLSERAAHAKTRSTLTERFGSEPSLSESGGGGGATPQTQLQDDLKKPFSEVFLREFHKQQARNR
jgi:hypothetical protein